MTCECKNILVNYFIEQHKELTKTYHEVTVVATQKSDFRPGLEANIRNRLNDLELKMKDLVAK